MRGVSVWCEFVFVCVCVVVVGGLRERKTHPQIAQLTKRVASSAKHSSSNSSSAQNGGGEEMTTEGFKAMGDMPLLEAKLSRQEAELTELRRQVRGCLGEIEILQIERLSSSLTLL